MFQKKIYKLISLVLFFMVSQVFSQETESPEVSLKFSGRSRQSAIALIISNRNTISVEIRDILREFSAKDLKIALVPADYTYDLTTLTTNNSPFVKEVGYVIKMSVLNKASKELLIRAVVEIVRLSDGQYVTKEMAGPRDNMNIISSQMIKLLETLMPVIRYDDPQISSVTGNIFTFPKKDFLTVKKGDEIVIRYADSRNGSIESSAIVQTFSNDMIIAKDTCNKVKMGDTVLRNTPKRNRFSFSVGVIMPTLGENTLVAQLDSNFWRSSARWPAGFKIDGEYERLLPYQLVSTTTFGINMDGVLGTYLMTGVGYRILYNTWEFTPYFRVGVLYIPIGLKIETGDSGSLQGFALQFGVNIGMSFMKRLGHSTFIGVDVGVQYFPLEYVSTLSGSKKVKPQWYNKGQLSDKSPLKELYPYLSFKMGWLF